MHIKIAITDDHPMVISGIKNMLYYYKHIEVCNTYNTGAALLEGLKHEQPDVLLLDIQLPDKSGNELARIISKAYPNVSILALSSMENTFHVKDMMQHGCKGYLVKTADPKVLIEAIEQVFLLGEEYIDASLKEQLLQNLLKIKKQNTPTSILTRREKEILQLIAAAHTSQQIAEKLHLSPRTVDNHRFSLLQKLNVKNTVGLINMALQMGLVE